MLRFVDVSIINIILYKKIRHNSPSILTTGVQ